MCAPSSRSPLVTSGFGVISNVIVASTSPLQPSSEALATEMAAKSMPRMASAGPLASARAMAVARLSPTAVPHAVLAAPTSAAASDPAAVDALMARIAGGAVWLTGPVQNSAKLSLVQTFAFASEAFQTPRKSKVRCPPFMKP